MIEGEHSQEPARLTPRVKVWIETDDGFAFGFGLIQILQAVESSGSIKQAAVDLDRSYRHVWDRIKEAERALRYPLVESKVGGQGHQRSNLTLDAERLIREFLRLRGGMISALESLGPAT
jgi:molybdate transport system regulatory protein